jgi:hypothetical protein
MNIRILSRNAAVNATPMAEQPRKTLANMADVLHGNMKISWGSSAVELGP